MLYLFELGRDCELSKLEVESLLGSKNIKFKIKDESRNVLVVECDKLDPKIIDEFGGVIKIAEVVYNSGKIEEIEGSLDEVDLYKGDKNKIEYYIDSFSTNLLSFVEDYLKDYFKRIRVKALYKKESEPSKLINKEILDKGLSILIFKNLIGKVIGITNPLELKRRDLDRPEVDHIKVISIRLAKILINLSKVKKNGLLLDPFCGSGTILQEALVKGVNVIGVDSDKTSVEQAEKNIDWLVNKYNIKNKFEIIKLDCRKLTSKIKNKVDCVVTEPYMGPYIRKLPTIREARELVLELSDLYGSLIENLARILKNNGRIVIVIPKFRTRENKVVFLDFESIAEKNGFNLAHKPINYGYGKSKILREICVLERDQ